MKHTLGPWVFKIVPTSCGRAFKINEPALINEWHGLIACIYDDQTSLNERSHDEHEANAHLMTAAPDLLIACKALLNAQTGGDWSRAVDIGCAAIEKAEDSEYPTDVEQPLFRGEEVKNGK